VPEANVLRPSSGLFEKVCLEVAEGYPDVEAGTATTGRSMPPCEAA
jgi:isocitrate/isopropylmalate dehydrogenase